MENNIKLPKWAKYDLKDIETLADSSNDDELIEVSTDSFKTEEKINKEIEMISSLTELDSLSDEEVNDWDFSNMDDILEDVEKSNKEVTDKDEIETKLRALHRSSGQSTGIKVIRREEPIANEQSILDLVIAMSKYSASDYDSSFDEEEAYRKKQEELERQRQRELEEAERQRRLAEEEERLRKQREAEEAERLRLLAEAEEAERQRKLALEKQSVLEEVSVEQPIEPKPEPKPEPVLEEVAIEEVPQEDFYEDVEPSEADLNLEFGGEESETYSLEDLQKKYKISSDTKL